MQAQITGLSGGGQPLSASLRSFFEPRFGADFSRVRIHTGSRAAALTRDLQAKAFTSGDSIVFGERRYQPGTTSGRWLLAHELTHTIQQSGVNGRSNAQRMMQRATCEHDAPPRDMECTAAESSPPTHTLWKRFPSP